jgi:hypothetical protein
MGEFMFRNLSVRLLPTDSRSPHCPGPDSVMTWCGTSTTQRVDVVPTLWCEGVTRLPFCEPLPSWIPVTLTNIVTVPPVDEVAQLATLKEGLQTRIARIEARERYLAEAAKPASVQQIDDLKAQLLAAVAELDEQRAQVEGGNP